MLRETHQTSLYVAVPAILDPLDYIKTEPKILTSTEKTRGGKLTAGKMAFADESMCAISACRFMSRSLSRETSPSKLKTQRGKSRGQKSQRQEKGGSKSRESGSCQETNPCFE